MAYVPGIVACLIVENTGLDCLLVGIFYWVGCAVAVLMQNLDGVSQIACF